MFDHIGLKVRDLAACIQFYERALTALGYELESSGDGYAGFGPPDAPALWLYQSSGADGTSSRGDGHGQHLPGVHRRRST